MGFCSAADCRLTVYPSVSAATQFWYVTLHKPVIRHADVQLLGSKALISLWPLSSARTPLLRKPACSCAAAWLYSGMFEASFCTAVRQTDCAQFGTTGLPPLPQPHRRCCRGDHGNPGTILYRRALSTTLLYNQLIVFVPVNPQAVNEPGFDVFTDNKRQVLYMTHTQSGAPIAFVAIGAMLVRASSWKQRLAFYRPRGCG